MMCLLNSTGYWQWNITLGLLGFWTLVHILNSGQKLTTFHQKTGRYPFPEKFFKTLIHCDIGNRWNIMEWRLECNGMWHCSAGWAVPDTRWDHCASVCSPTQHHIPEDWILQQHFCENVVSHTACSKIGKWLWMLELHKDSKESGW